MKSSLANKRSFWHLLAGGSVIVLSACGGADGAVSDAATLDTLTASRRPVEAPKPPSPPGTATDPTPPSTPSGTLAVNWSAPPTNSDGTPLNDLAGYRVLVGTVSGAYSMAYTINDPSATSYQVGNLGSGTYYVVVKAFDTSENESVPSAEASKTIR